MMTQQFLAQTNGTWGTPLISAGFGFILGLIATVLGIAFVEPFRAKMTAYLEFGKWLTILPLELRQMQRMTKHIASNLSVVIEQANNNPDWQPQVPFPIGEKLEVSTVLEIRNKILGWKRTEEAFRLVTEIWSAVVRTNWSLGVYNEQMAEVISQSNTSSRDQKLHLAKVLHQDFTRFGLFADHKISVIEAMLRVWEEDAPSVFDVFRKLPFENWIKKKAPLSVRIGFDKIIGMPYVEITNLTKDRLVVHQVAAYCGLQFYNNGLAFFPLSPVQIEPKSKFAFKIDIWHETSVVVQRKADADKSINDFPFEKKTALQIFRSITLMPKQESWIEVEYDEHPSSEFLRGEVKWAFESARNAASPEKQKLLEHAD